MTQNSTVTWVRQDASWSSTSAIEVRTTDSSVPDVPYVQGAGSLASLTYASSNPNIASIRSVTGVLTLTGQAGSTVITASLPANGNGGAAASASYTLTVYDPAAQIKLTTTTRSVRAGQALTLAASMMLGSSDTGFPGSAQNTANNYFSYTVGKAGDTGSANINGTNGSLTGVSAGSVTVKVTLHSTRQYTAMSAEFVLTVEKGVSVLSWVGTPATAIRMDQTPSPITALPSGSTRAVRYDSSNPDVAKFDDPATGIITLVGAGSTTISAVLEWDDNYNAALTLTYVLTVNKGESTLSWTSTPTLKMGEPVSAAFAASHTGSKAEVVYKRINASSSSHPPSDVLAIDPATGVVNLIGAGSATISAFLPEDNNYLALTITYNVTVDKGDSTLGWLSKSADSIKMSETPSIPQVSYTGSTTPVAYTSDNHGVATIDKVTGVITLKGIGNVTISAELKEDDNYQAAPEPISYTFTVNTGDSTLSWASTPAATVYMGDVLPAFLVSKSGSTAAIVYKSDTHSVATIDASGVITLNGRGPTIITAELPADGNYYAAPQVITYAMTVSSDATISLLYSPFSVYVNEKLTLVPVTRRADTDAVVVEDLTYHYAVGKTGDTGTATIDPASGVLTGLSNGSVTVTVTCTSNTYRVTGTTCTVTVLASSCVVSLPVTTMAIKLGGGNDSSYQIVPTTKLNGVVVHNGAPYGDGTDYDFAYSYVLSNVSPTGSVRVSPDGLVTGTGTNFGTAKVIISVTFTNPTISTTSITSATLIVNVIDPDTPRPVSGNTDDTNYPAYTGSEPPQLAAVQALLDDLMPVADGKTHDDPNSTAAQLFGLDLSYFENIKPDGKKIVFPISESNNIYQINCTATSHLRLKVTKELVLGDSISFTVTRGNTFNVNVNLNNKDDLAGQDADNDGVDDSVRTGHGVVNTSITGVAAELEIKAFSAYEDELYPYQKNPGMTDADTNFIYLPKFSKLRLDYGRVNSSRRDRVVKMEFIGPGKANKNSAGRNDHDQNNGNLNTLEPIKRHPDRLVPEECAYAEFTQITRDGFKPYKGPSKGIGGSGRGNPSILPDETHLGLLGDYFHDDTDGAKAMAGYDTIDLPDYVLNDELFDTTQVDGGVNFLQFRKGKGRLRHEYMDNTIKMLQKAKALFNVNIAGGIRDFFVAGAVSELDFSGTMICHSWISPVGFNHTVAVISSNLAFAVAKSSSNYTILDCREYLTGCFEQVLGASVIVYKSKSDSDKINEKLDKIREEANVFSTKFNGIINRDVGIKRQIALCALDNSQFNLDNATTSILNAMILHS